tara:strand:+ start:2160 stop:2363 length:204 start_codon:yes stop_codon:yes gene_type:complete
MIEHFYALTEFKNTQSRCHLFKLQLKVIVGLDGCGICIGVINWLGGDVERAKGARKRQALIKEIMTN